MTAPLANLRDIGKQYDGFGWALRAIDLRIEPGCVMGVVGINGSGKSTLLRIVAGHVAPTSGTLELFGNSVSISRDRELRHKVTLAEQDLAIDPEMTVSETILFFGALNRLSAKDSKMRRDILADQFGLDAILHRRLSRVSGGQRQRVHLALSLVHEPLLTLFDEPTNGLDMQSRAAFWNTLHRHVNDERSVVVSTHLLTEAEEHCDPIVVIHEGQSRAQGSVADVKRKTNTDSLEAAFVAISGCQPSMVAGRGAGRGGGRGGRRANRGQQP